MSLDPAVGTEVGGDAGGEEAERDGECADDPGELDASLEDEEVEDAEDEDEDGGLGEEAGAAASGDDDEFDERREFRRAEALSGVGDEVDLSCGLGFLEKR